VWAEDNLTTEDLNKKLLLDTDNDVWTVWHLIAHGGNLGIFLENGSGLKVTNNIERK